MGDLLVLTPGYPNLDRFAPRFPRSGLTVRSLAIVDRSYELSAEAWRIMNAAEQARWRARAIRETRAGSLARYAGRRLNEHRQEVEGSPSPAP
jgi:hypothetical protein